MDTRTFIAIGRSGSPEDISGVIVNDHEQQFDCDYHQEFEDDEDGDPARFEVVVTVRELGPL